MLALTCGLSRRPAALFGQQAQAAAVSRCLDAERRAASRAGGARCAVRHLHARHTCKGLGGQGACLLRWERATQTGKASCTKQNRTNIPSCLRAHGS